MELKKGLYIIIEGIDGSGKTTFAKNLQKHLEDQGLSVVLTKQPGGTEIGQKLREILQYQKGVSKKTDFLLFAADRAQNISEIVIPSLDQKKVVISDRSGYSSLAYQGYAKGLDLEFIKTVNAWATNNIEPDIIFYLKLDLKTAMERIGSRKEVLTNFENIKIQEKAALGFDELFKNKKNVIILDANKNPEEIFSEAIKKMENV
jgi:dTMP kinase